MIDHPGFWIGFVRQLSGIAKSSACCVLGSSIERCLLWRVPWGPTRRSRELPAKYLKCRRNTAHGMLAERKVTERVGFEVRPFETVSETFFALLAELPPMTAPENLNALGRLQMLGNCSEDLERPQDINVSQPSLWQTSFQANRCPSSEHLALIPVTDRCGCLKSGLDEFCFSHPSASGLPDEGLCNRSTSA